MPERGTGSTCDQYASKPSHWCSPRLEELRYRARRTLRCFVMHEVADLLGTEACKLEKVSGRRSIHSALSTGSCSPQYTRVRISMGGMSGIWPVHTALRAARFPRYQLNPPWRFPGFIKLSTKRSRSLSKACSSAAQCRSMCPMYRRQVSRDAPTIAAEQGRQLKVWYQTSGT